MNGVRFVAFACLAALCRQGVGREYEVRLLEGTERRGVWGTTEFRVSVNELGVLRHVTVRGDVVLKQAAALYTSPIPPGEKSGIRTVQGEGFGARGLTVQEPSMQTRSERGRQIFEFRHAVANQAVFDGKTLCEVEQRIVISPTGSIEVHYAFDWRETLSWQTFMLLLLFNEETCRDCEYLVLTEGKNLVGALEPGPVLERRIRSLPFEQLTVRPACGPVHFVWDNTTTCSLHWAKSIQLSIRPRSLGHQRRIYQGQNDRVEYRILLPVSQQ